jgi:ribosomal protein S18 acetylase RimI-like enzyme
MQNIRTARPEDAARCFRIEIEAYDSEAAAPLDRIATRIATYPEGFIVLETDGQVTGFINSGCTWDVEMADDAFKALIGHDPEAPNAVILSVAVDPAYQGRGLSRALMEAFVARMAAMGKASIHLICRAHHVSMYEKFGYRYVQPSDSAHGGMQWHEMVMTL